MNKKIEIEVNCFSIDAVGNQLSIQGLGGLSIYENSKLMNIDPIFPISLINYEENKKYKITIEQIEVKND